MTDEQCEFERLTDLGDTRPTLVVGLPGLGMVGSIAADQVARQLGLDHYGNVRSEAFPPVASFQDGRIREAVRVHARRDPDVMTLRSGVPIPPKGARPLAQCVLEDLAEDLERVIVIVGTQAHSEEDQDSVNGMATTEALHDELRKAGIEVDQGEGLVGGPGGALLAACYRENVPGIGLVVETHPQLPDPGAARALIEEALEPLVDFDLDTSELKERDEEIKRQLERLARHYRETTGEGEGGSDSSEPSVSMYQ